MFWLPSSPFPTLGGSLHVFCPYQEIRLLWLGSKHDSLPTQSGLEIRIYFTQPAFLAVCILSYHKTCTCHAQECAEGEYQSLPREAGCVFCCVVGLYPNNLQEACASGREWRINIADRLFIRRLSPAGVSGARLRAVVSQRG